MMQRRTGGPVWMVPVLLILGAVAPTRAAEPSPEGVEFFEKKIRPLLADNCYACHSDRGKKPQGDLRIDMIESLLRGGASGKPAIVPGDPDKSLLIIAIRQTDA